MSLLDLKTDLKSLKYGKDRPGGGDSGQPYQQVDINKIDNGFNRFRMTKFDDGLVRGGIVGAANASIVDTFRIGKFLTDFPKGSLFIAKQIGLQMSNPVLETKKLKTDSPIKGGGFLRNVGNFIINSANKIVNAVGPTRIYNLGINTIAQVPVNAFGVHFNRHGLLPVQDDQTKYLAVVQNNNNEENNRLTGLRNRFGLGVVNRGTQKGQIFTRKKELKSIMSAGSTSDILLKADEIQANKIADYVGGPNSVYGIGRTLIKRTPERTNDSLKIDYAKNRNYNSQHVSEVKISSSFDFEISNKTNSNLASSSFNLIKDTNLKINGSFITNTYKEYKENKKDNIVTVSNDLGVSTYTSSSLSSNKFKLPIPTSLVNNSITYNGGTWDGALTASKDLGVSKQYFSGSSINIPKDVTTYSQIVTQNLPISVDGNNNVTSLPSGNKGKTPIRNASYSAYQKIIESKKLRETTYTLDGNQVNAFGIYGNGFPVRETLGEILPDSTQLPVYTNKDKVIKLNIPWNKVTREQRVGSGKQDQINLTPLFENATGTMGDDVTIGGKSYNINDLVKFRIQSINYNNPGLGKWMIFRAYITQFSDSTDANWNEVKYAGRGDKFYVYDGFSRKVSIGFKVAALSAEEMQPMYQKLNYLMGNLMGSYENNLLHGNLVKMTVGNWLDGQDGILNNVSYTIPQDSPWEIAINTVNGVEPLILPHVIEVSMTFTPIGSQTKGVNKLSSKDSEISHIAQNINDTQYITNYSKV